MMAATTKEIIPFRNQLVALQKDRVSFLKRCSRVLAEQLLALAIDRTPVWSPVKTKEHLAAMDEGVEAQRYSFRTEDGKKRSYKLLRKGEAIWKRYWAGHTGGFLRRSWKIGESQGSNSIYLTQLKNFSNYASYIELGHRQTPGRFVPMLGVRLKRSWIPGQHMLEKSEQDLERVKDTILQQEQDAWLERRMK